MKGHRKYIFSSEDNNENDDDLTDDNHKGVATSSNSVAVIKVGSARPLSSLSKETKDNSSRSDACVSSGKRK
jgi:hypothetical protein